MTRRSLFRTAAATAALAALGRGRALGMMLFARPERRAEPADSPNRFTRGGRSLVAVAADADPAHAVEVALELIGGLERLLVKGKTILVKPNVVSGKPHPTTTNPAVVAAVTEALYRAGAKEVVVGDMSALIAPSTLRNMRRCGIRAAAERAGAKVVAFEDYEWVEVKLPGARHLDKALVTEWLYRADLVINLPVIKTHRSASYTICLKNFIGCTHLRQRPYLIDSDHWEELVTEFNLAYVPALNIVDGTVSMVEGGPWQGKSAPTGLIIASGDRVAADAVGLGIIKHFGLWDKVTSKGVWEQRQLVRALELGIGQGPEGIELVAGEGDENFALLMAEVERFTGLNRAPRTPTAPPATG